MWLKSIVFQGSKVGIKIGFPTTNLNASGFPQYKKQGVYSCQVKHQNAIYHGVLYFGPRLIFHEKKTVLEIHILDFDNNLYGQIIEYKIGRFLRQPIKFTDLNALKKQLIFDVENVRR